MSHNSFREYPQDYPCKYGHYSCATREGGACSDETASFDRRKEAAREEAARKVIRASDSLIKLASEALNHPRNAARNADYMEIDIEHLRAAVKVLSGEQARERAADREEALAKQELADGVGRHPMQDCDGAD